MGLTLMNRKSTLIGKAQGWPTSTFQPLLTASDNSVNFLGFHFRGRTC